MFGLSVERSQVLYRNYRRGYVITISILSALLYDAGSTA